MTKEMTYEYFEPDFRADFMASSNPDRFRFEQFRPAYRYGYDLAVSRNLSEFDWDDIDSDSHRRWEELNPGTWNRYSSAVRYAFGKVRATISEPTI